MARKLFLSCGILSSLLYAAMIVFVPMAWEGYSSASQTVSELSAIGAPSRPLWVALGIAYDLLLVAFGLGVWKSAGEKRALRVAGGLLVATGVISLAWPPMHLRGEGFTLTDTMHIVFTAAWGLLMLAAIGFAATALGKRFRLYSVATVLIMLAFVALTSLDAPRIPQNLPTPWIGVWERINIAAYLLWVAVLAVALLRAQGDGHGRSRPGI
jgi:hypothetical protein